MPPILAHSFDVETTSPRIGPSRLISVGACCLEIPTNGPVTVVNSFMVNIEWPEPLVYDHDETEQFWRDHPEAFAKCTTGGVTPEAAAVALEAHVRAVQDVAAKRKAKYILVTDNSFFDVGWLDWLLTTYSTTALPLRHNYVTGWMSAENVVDVTQRLRALRDAGFRITVPKAAATSADHTPLNDATAIAHKYAFYRRWTRRKSATK
jgi:hypothetical protein